MMISQMSLLQRERCQHQQTQANSVIGLLLLKNVMEHLNKDRQVLTLVVGRKNDRVFSPLWHHLVTSDLVRGSVDRKQGAGCWNQCGMVLWVES
jgi:hypothetical protein